MLRWLPIFGGFFLVGCAAIFEPMVGESDDPSLYDRGYESTTGSDCSGRFCLSEAVEGDSEQGIGNESRKSDRAPANARESLEGSRAQSAIRTRDVILGMSRQEVLESWGEPAQREVAGRGNSGHERWTYGSRFSLQGARTLIFEDGRITGWHR
jgi:hypothetical protein